MMMMMAQDSGPPPRALDDQTVSAVRGALVAYLAGPERTGELRVALCAMAEEARAKGILPEQLLVALKDIWYALPQVRRMEEAAEQVRLLQRVVTMCITEYYGG
jgi:hypothetical protein